MDIYSIFAMVMSLLSGLALTLALVIYLDARKSVSQNRHIMMHWCESVLTQQDSNRLLQQKIDRALAERVRNLETFRVNHAHRLNAAEDLIELLNCVADPDEAAEVGQRSHGEPGAGEMDIVDVHESRAARSALDRAQIVDDYNEACSDDTLLRQWDSVTPANPTDPNPLDAEMQAIVERRFLQGL